MAVHNSKDQDGRAGEAVESILPRHGFDFDMDTRSCNAQCCGISCVSNRRLTSTEDNNSIDRKHD